MSMHLDRHPRIRRLSFPLKIQHPRVGQDSHSVRHGPSRLWLVLESTDRLPCRCLARSSGGFCERGGGKASRSCRQQCWRAHCFEHCRCEPRSGISGLVLVNASGQLESSAPEAKLGDETPEKDVVDLLRVHTKPPFRLSHKKPQFNSTPYCSPPVLNQFFAM